MDELDTKITRILQEDGRVSNIGIARQVGVSEGTIRRRVKKLVQEEYIRVVAVPDPAKVGLWSEALIGVQVELARVEQVATALLELDEVNWVAVTTGGYDLFAWAALPTVNALGMFLRAKVGTIPGVRHTETFVCLDKSRGRVTVI